MQGLSCRPCCAPPRATSASLRRRPLRPAALTAARAPWVCRSRRAPLACLASCRAAPRRARRQLLSLLVPPALGVDPAAAAAAAEGSALAGLTDSHVGRLLRDECYSHLMEVLVAVMPPALRSELHVRFLRGWLLPLANHHSANFVVQAWVASAGDAQQVRQRDRTGTGRVSGLRV